MPTFEVHFFTQTDWASTNLEAETAEHALYLAHAMETDGSDLEFQSYDSGGVEHIEVWDARGVTAAEWRSDALWCRLAAGELLQALERAVTALNTAPRFQVPSLGADSYKIAAACDAAIRAAKPPAT